MALELTISSRFMGMPGLAQGGYTCGVAARMIRGPATVTLRKPVRVGSPLVLEGREADWVLLDERGVVAEARRSAAIELTPPTISWDEAETGATAYVGLTSHPFPGCVCCGPDCSPSEGLRIFTGPPGARDLVAAPWTPGAELDATTGEVPGELVWTALDCPAIWAVVLTQPVDSSERALTGSITLDHRAPIKTGSPYIVVGWPVGRQGRTVLAGAAVLSDAGELLAIAQQALVVTDAGFPLGLDEWRRWSARQPVR